MPAARPIALLALLLLALLPVASRADVLTTSEGLVLEGEVERDADGNYVVQSPEGRTVLPARRVVAVQEGEGPRARLERRAAALAPEDAEGWYRLALDAQAAGLADLARRACEQVVASRPDHPAARRMLGQEQVEGEWVSAAQARRRRGLVLYEGRWMLPAEVEGAARAEPPPVEGASDEAQARELVRTLAGADPVLMRPARLAWALTPAPQRYGAALAALYDGEPAVRATAARLLGEQGDEAALRPLIFSAARDVDPDVRREAVLAARSFGHEDTAVPFVRALGSRHPALVANAAQALGHLGDLRAVNYLIKRLRSHGYSGRNYVSFMTQVSYVRDYDVEIAQASNIANPDVATILEGVILDVRVLDAAYERTWVEAAIVDALSRLAGRPLRDAADAEAWYVERATTLPDFPDTPGSPGSRRTPGRYLGAGAGAGG